MRHQIGELQKDALNTRKTIDFHKEQLDDIKIKIEKAKELAAQFTTDHKIEVSDTVVRLRREIKEAHDLARSHDSSLSSYSHSLTKYDIIITDCKFKTDQAVRFIQNYDNEKANKNEVLPKISQLQREIASLKIVVKKRIEDDSKLHESSEADIYLQNEPSYSTINQNLKEFVKLSTMIAKTVANEERLMTLQNFVKEKVESFQKSKLQNVEADLRDKEIAQKEALIDKLQEILKYELKPSTLQAKRNRLSSWQTEWDPSAIKSTTSVVNHSESLKGREGDNLKHKFPLERSNYNKSAIDCMSPKTNIADSAAIRNYEINHAKSNKSRTRRIYVSLSNFNLLRKNQMIQ